VLPRLAVIIPTHHRADLLHACLTSVTRYAPRDTEIIVVDDGSPSGAGAAVAGRFQDVRVIKLGRRHGFCVAANTGIRAARSDIVELLNDDTEVTEGWAEPALGRFEDPNIGAVAPLVLCWPGPVGVKRQAVIDSAGDRYYLGGVAGKRGHRQPLGPAFLRPCQVFGASASSAFFRREAVLRVGALPESFGAYFEDVDLAFRLHRAGYQVLFEPASRVLHHVSASYGRRPRRRLLEQQSHNEERVFWRNLPGRVLGRALPHHVAVLAGKAHRRWQEGSLIPFLCGRLRVLTEVSALIRHRRWLRNLGPAGAPGEWQVEPRFWQ
jgi:GT2 family glycosyltransferase